MIVNLGSQAKLYILSTGTRVSWGGATDSAGIFANLPPANLTEANLVKDITLNLSKAEADATTRASSWKLVKASTKEAAIDGEILYDVTDAAFELLRDAFISGATLGVACLSGPKTESNAEGLWADMQVLKFDRSEALEGVQAASFTLKPTVSNVPPEWVRILGS